jgi:two-component system phosphate regulon response regulator PhoB
MTSRERILVVDDHIELAEITARQLRGAGYDASLATDGPEALKLVARERPACVLLDVTMPGMSGLDVLAQLKRDPATASIPIVLVTACVRDTDLELGYREGADYYITKPFTAAQIVNGVRLVLGRGSPVRARAAH